MQLPFMGINRPRTMHMRVICYSAQNPAAVGSRTFDQQRYSWNTGSHDCCLRIRRLLAVFDGILRSPLASIGVNHPGSRFDGRLRPAVRTCKTSLSFRKNGLTGVRTGESVEGEYMPFFVSSSLPQAVRTHFRPMRGILFKHNGRYLTR